MQAIQLAWTSVKQLLSDNNQLVVENALSFILSSGAITSVVVASAQLPLFAFATPKTRTGVLRHLWHPQPCYCIQRSCYRPAATQKADELPGRQPEHLLCTCSQAGGCVADARILAAG